MLATKCIFNCTLSCICPCCPWIIFISLIFLLLRSHLLARFGTWTATIHDIHWRIGRAMRTHLLPPICNFDNAFLLFYCGGFFYLSRLRLPLPAQMRIKITNYCRVKLSSNNIKNYIIFFFKSSSVLNDFLLFYDDETERKFLCFVMREL